MTQQPLPYFDYLLEELENRNPSIETSFGRHVHWGYWDEPRRAICDDADYAKAAERLTHELCGLACIVEGDRVLDVGCGFGGTLASLNERFASLRLHGLNIDGRQLARARQLVKPLAANTVGFCQGDACALPFANASFDRLLAVECIFHFPSREAFFKEAFRVLRPGGVLALSDFIPAHIYLPISGLATSRWFENYSVFGRCNVQYTAMKYRRLAKQSGLSLHTARNITRHTLPTYRYLQLMARNTAAGASGRVLGSLVRSQEMLGRLGLLNYYLLSFSKT